MVTGSIRRAKRNQGILSRSLVRPGVELIALIGNAARSAAVIAGCSRGSLRKNQNQMQSQNRLASPTITNETRHETQIRSPAINGGVNALPMRANECVIPCAEPHCPSGVQLAIARVAVGKAAPSPKPNARRITMRDARPLAAPVSIVAMATTAQLTARVSRAPN